MSATAPPHPLPEILRRAAAGSSPPPDGEITVLPAPPGAFDAAVGFTAHLVVAADISDDKVRAQLGDADFGRWMSAPFLLWMAERLGTVALSHDLVLAAVGAGEDPDLDLVEQPQSYEHRRVQRAASHRADVRVFTAAGSQGVLVLGRGLAGRWELAFEVELAAQRRGLGRRLALAARALVGEEEPLFAQVAPGNAASVRAVLAAGFRPIGSEVLFPRVG